MHRLKDQLISIKPRETAGTRTSNRIDYQQDYAIFCLLELHENGGDYRILLDYHDDIVVLFPSDDPKDLHFYQVKTDKTRNWTIKRLTNKPKDKTLSILAKLFLNASNFPENTRSLNFVSNARFSVKLVTGDGLGQDTIVLNNLADEELENIRKKLKDQINLEVDESLLKNSHLKVSELSINGHGHQVLGKLQLFLSERFSQNDLPGQTLLKTLKTYITHKQTNESENKSFDELCKNKSICKVEFDDMLDSVVFKKNFKELWHEISTHLQKENIGYQDIIAYRQKCEMYLVERINQLNETLQNVRKNVVKFLAHKANHGRTLRETIDKASQTLLSDLDKITEIKDRDFFEAMVLVEIFKDEKR